MADKDFKEFQKWQKRTKVTCQTPGCEYCDRELTNIQDKDSEEWCTWDETERNYSTENLDFGVEDEEEETPEIESPTIVCPGCKNSLDVTIEGAGDEMEIVHYRK